MAETATNEAHAEASAHAHAEHFESLERQAEAARFGMWVFLASEVLLFGGLFTLYTCYRFEHPAAFARGVAMGALAIGTTNTAILIFSSFLVALAVHGLREGQRRRALALIAATIACGLVFLVLKGIEYAGHIRDGLLPGGRGAELVHARQGLDVFFTLYYGMTGLHALHVIVGLGVLAVLGYRIHRGALTEAAPHPLELGAMYWHLIDIIWIFLWPLFYLTRGGGA